MANFFYENFRKIEEIIKDIIIIEEEQEPKVGAKYSIPFYYYSEDELLEIEGGVPQGIGIEVEMLQSYIKTKDFVNLVSQYGLIGRHGKSSRKTQQKLLTPINISMNYANMEKEIDDIVRKLVLPNTSSFIKGDLVNDTTINNLQGGPEAIWFPISEAMIPFFKLEFTRFTHYAKLFGCKAENDSTSMHFHLSASLLGNTEEEREEWFTEFLWFLIKNREFMKRLCDRYGEGVTLSDIAYYIGDPLGELTEEALMKHYLMMKSKGLEMIREGLISKSENITHFVDDTRSKGFLNMVYRDEHDSFEFRWFGSTFDTELSSARHEFFRANLEFLKNKPVTTNTKVSSMQKLVNWMEDLNYKYRFPHYWNFLMSIDYCACYAKDKSLVYTPNWNLDEIINYSDQPYEEAKAYVDYVLLFRINNDFSRFDPNKLQKLIKEKKDLRVESKITLTEESEQLNLNIKKNSTLVLNSLSELSTSSLSLSEKINLEKVENIEEEVVIKKDKLRKRSDFGLPDIQYLPCDQNHEMYDSRIMFKKNEEIGLNSEEYISFPEVKNFIDFTDTEAVVFDECTNCDYCGQEVEKEDLYDLFLNQADSEEEFYSEMTEDEEENEDEHIAELIKSNIKQNIEDGKGIYLNKIFLPEIKDFVEFEEDEYMEDKQIAVLCSHCMSSLDKEHKLLEKIKIHQVYGK